MTQTLQHPAAIDRLNIYKVSPELYDAMMKLSTASAKDIDPTIGELVKIRASQINHCAFCLDMHVADARKQGETEQRLALVAAWEEAGDLFTERERAALELTEAITARNAPLAESVSRALCEMPYLDLAGRVDLGDTGLLVDRTAEERP